MSEEDDRTLWVGNLSERVTEEILYELFLQAGPLEKVKIPTERDGRQKSFGFVTFTHDASVPYTIQLMDGIPLFGKNLRLQARPKSIHAKQQQQLQLMQQQPYLNNMPVNMGNSRQPGSPVGNPCGNNMPPQQMIGNPYMKNQPMRSQVGVQSNPPSFQRSNTWHGNDLNQQDKESRDHGGRDRDRDRHSNRDRDRSGRRDDYNSGRDNYRGGSSYHDNGRNEDFETKRQRVLQKQSEASNRYRHMQQHQRSSPQHSPHQSYQHRRGRY